MHFYLILIWVFSRYSVKRMKPFKGWCRETVSLFEYKSVPWVSSLFRFWECICVGQKGEKNARVWRDDSHVSAAIQTVTTSNQSESQGCHFFCSHHNAGGNETAPADREGPDCKTLIFCTLITTPGASDYLQVGGTDHLTPFNGGWLQHTRAPFSEKYTTTQSEK